MEAGVNFDTSRLLHALTLRERLELWRRCPEEIPDAFDPELAQRRLEAWKSQPPFDTDGLLRERLSAEGLDEATWRRLAGEGPEAAARRLVDPPVWLDSLQDAFSEPARAPLPDSSATLDQMPAQLTSFLPLAHPVVRRGLERLRQGIRRLQASRAAVPFDPEGISELLHTLLARRLTLMMGRALTLELHVAGHRGLLAGETPEARFESFVRRLRDLQVAADILSEYPVLARQLVVAVDHWAEFSLDLLVHLTDAWPAVGEQFAGGEDPGRVAKLRGGMGDSHRGGRSVVALETTTGLRLIYKPRPMAVDLAFQRLLCWLSDRGETRYRPLRILDQGTHGFVEHVDAAACRTTAEVARFYRRQGGYLALLHLLNATDFHHENLIAAGEHPVLVDLEALFHPPLLSPDLPSGDPRLVAEPLIRSVLRIGLLPHRIWGDEENEGMDVSGLAASREQQVREGILDLDGAGTDRMRFVRRFLNLPGAANRPTLGGEDVDLGQYADDVSAGFADVYRLLVAHRDELLAEGGLLSAFAEAEVRVLVRPTRGYAMLLSESFHPDFLRSALDRDRFFDRLWNGVRERPYLARLIPHERRALEEIDIPLFTTRPGSKDLWSGQNDRLPDFFGETGLERLRHDFEFWDEKDLERQTWLIRTTLGSVRLFTGEASSSEYELSEGEEASRGDLVAAARRVADRLEKLAFRRSGEAWWYDFQLLGNDFWTLQPAGPGLYSGLPGIAVFLAYLGAVTEDAAVTGLGRAAFTAWRTMLAEAFGRPALESPVSEETPVGAFSGLGGGLYALAHLGELWDDPALATLAEDHLDRLAAAVGSDRQLDVIGGVAGALLALLAFHRGAPSSRASARALGLARRCGERLLATSQAGRGWMTPIAERPLAGFSHGAAGIAWALLDLAAVTGEARFREAALGGFAYERSIFSPEEKNWPDLRDIPESPADGHPGTRRRSLVAWCHGASGVGLSRLLALDHLADPDEAAAARQEIAVAVKTTLARGMGMNLSLCHGDLGQLDILLQAARKLGDHALERRVYRLAAGVLEVIEHEGWLCGMPRGAEPPGMMLGLAGIGYGLLRLAMPERVPSILALAPPVPNTGRA